MLGGEATTVADLTDIPSIIDKIADVASGGGGGSSDFKIVNMTIVDNRETTATFATAYVPSIFTHDGVSYLMPMVFIKAGNATYPVILYKNHALLFLDDANGRHGPAYFKERITLSGDVELADGGTEYNLIISGNFTMTLTEA